MPGRERPIDVQVLYKRAQRRTDHRLNLLGAGMLERARATSLGLLGATAAVGLAIVAIALNQGWPLIAGSSIPPLPREKVSGATVVSRPAPRAPTRQRPSAQPRVRAKHRAVPRSQPPAPGVATPEPSGGLVVATAAPTGGNGGGVNKPPAPHGKPPALAPPAQQPPAPPTPQPAASPPSQPAHEASPSAPEAVASEVPPEESSVPPWSQGRGHAYGRSESRYEEEDDSEEPGWGHDDSHGHWGDEGHGYWGSSD